MHEDKILVLDFGSQYTQLIARRVRESKVYSEIFPFNASITKIKKFSPKGIILSGGPSSIYDKRSPKPDNRILNLGIPILGICYGMQFLAHSMKGKVSKAQKREYGRSELHIDDTQGLFHKVLKKSSVWMSHGDRIDKIPPGFKIIAHTDNSPIAAMASRTNKFYALQFHPEVVHTDEGTKILQNFIFNICACKPTWKMSSFINWSVADIREKAGNKKILCALSGGVDSSVVALLVHRAVAENLTCIFVDNGLLRKGEAEKVINTFKRHFHIKLVHIDASKVFLNKLKGVTDPEKKRKIIGNEFIHIFEKKATKIKDVEYLAQGTLYPDVIESVSFKGPSATIKSHHNVGGELSLPDEICWRHPFPGPGLAIRCLGEVTKKRLNILREADAIVLEEIKKAGLYKSIWQAFAVILPVKSVGVMGDERTYENVISVRAVYSLDGMTADWAKLPYHILGRISNRIINEIKGVNRVVFDISSKPPSTIEWE
jgi:GMP synthase (glutamine-hydrolysing)